MTDDFESKKLNPKGSYQHPHQVLADASLTREQKIEVLLAWRYDALRLQEAADENMAGGEPDLLPQVTNALLQLDYSPSAAGDPLAKSAPWWRSLTERVAKAFGARN